jgi:hypothetical protein
VGMRILSLGRRWWGPFELLAESATLHRHIQSESRCSGYFFDRRVYGEFFVQLLLYGATCRGSDYRFCADFTSVEQPVAGTPTAVADGNASRDNASERDHVFCRAYETNVSTAPTPVPGTGRDQLDVHKIAIENPIPPKIRPKLKTARLDCLRILRGGPLCLFGKMFLDWMTQLRIALVCGAIG